MHREAIDRVQAALQGGATTLDLSRLDLDSLPDGLAELTRLEQLYLTDNLLVGLPPWLGRLEHLTEIRLSRNELPEIPAALRSMPNLRFIFLDANRIESVPDWVSVWSHLEAISFYGNNITASGGLPRVLRQLQELAVDEALFKAIVNDLTQAERLSVLMLNGVRGSCNVGRLQSIASLRALFLRECKSKLPAGLSLLTQLQQLDVSTNQLTALPESVGHLTQLQRLNVWNNRLTTLPESVGRLKQLQELDISGNQLVTLPESMGQLKQLQRLYVWNNQLTVLPDSVGLLEQLQQLNVSGNQLGALPDSIGQLSRLQKLDISGNQLTALPESVGQLTQLQQLNVWNNRLTALPESVGQLAQLQQLYVSKNQLTALPECVGQLEQLQQFYVSNNRLTALPDGVGRLVRLQQLNISNNQVTALPESVWQITGLQQLNAWNNQLTKLSESVGQFTQLQQLYISNNQLTALPESVGRLIQLQQLDASNNQLIELPESVGQLTQLQQLNVSGNQLTALPESVEQLAQLQLLNVSGNQLTALPESVWQLKQLQQLYASNNRLTALPESVAQLTRLEQLYVWKNQLTALPESIGQLTQLQHLHVSNNQLTALPDSVSLLRKLQHLNVASNQLESLPGGLLKLDLVALWVHDNPALELSASVLGKYEQDPYKRLHEAPPREPRGILAAYFAVRSRDAEPLNEVKLVLVGRGSAGKSSIVRRLIKGTFFRNQKETEGIDIARWKLACGDREVRVNIWDFAGQVVTHATHQFFLSESSVYVLVLTGREDTQKFDADYWLKLIRAFAADSEGQVAPVVVALNKFEAHPFKVDRLALKERYPFVVGFVETDCRSGLGIDALKSVLAEMVAAMPLVRQGFKRRWWKIKRALEAAQRQQNYIPYSSFQTICAKQGETDASRQRFLADVFHALGVALNYGRDARLRDATVLNPRWVTEGIYKLLLSAVADDGNAVLTMAAVRAVLPNEPEAMQRYLVALMLRFDLAFPLNEGADQWLVPQRLPAEQPDLGPYVDPADDSTRLRFVYPVVPEGLLPRFIARTYPLSEQAGPSGPLPRWASGVVLQQGDAKALVRVDTEERQVTVVVSGGQQARLELLGVIQSDFRTIHRDIKGLGEREELEVEGRRGVYVDVGTLKADERARNPSSAQTPAGTLALNATLELNRLSEPAARDDSVRRARVFISYTSANARFRDELLIRLKPLKETHGLLDGWEDRCIAPGGDWDGEIRSELELADVVLLLVSAKFLASDYVRGVEVRRALERARNKECTVVPIILEKVDWTSESFGWCNAIPRKGKAIQTFAPRGDGWFEVGRELRDLLEGLKPLRRRSELR